MRRELGDAAVTGCRGCQWERLPESLQMLCLSFVGAYDLGRAQRASRKVLRLCVEISRVTNQLESGTDTVGAGALGAASRAPTSESGARRPSAEGAEQGEEQGDEAAVQRAVEVMRATARRMISRPQFSITFLGKELDLDGIEEDLSRVVPGEALFVRVRDVQTCSRESGVATSASISTMCGAFADADCVVHPLVFRAAPAEAGGGGGSRALAAGPDLADGGGGGTGTGAHVDADSGDDTDEEFPRNLQELEHTFDRELEAFEARLAARTPAGLSSAQYWRGFCLVGGGPEGRLACSRAVKALAVRHPGAIVIGGVCGACGCRSEGGRVVTTAAGAMLLAFGGNVPIKASASAGLEPVSSHVLTICEAQPGRVVLDARAKVQFVPTPPGGLPAADLCRITSLRDAAGSPVGFDAWLAQVQPRNRCFGFEGPGDQGFSVLECGRLKLEPPYHSDAIYARCGRDLTRARVKVYRTTAKGVRTEMEAMLRQLKRELESRDENLLGALMFSCAARGPERSHTIPGHMFDAAEFHRHFGAVPLSGFYGFGEVGPVARAESTHRFQGDDPIDVQTFTAVFGFFVAPKLAPQFRGSQPHGEAWLRTEAFLRGERHHF